MNGLALYDSFSSKPTGGDRARSGNFRDTMIGHFLVEKQKAYGRKRKRFFDTNCVRCINRLIGSSRVGATPSQITNLIRVWSLEYVKTRWKLAKKFRLRYAEMESCVGLWLWCLEPRNPLLPCPIPFEYDGVIVQQVTARVPFSSVPEIAFVSSYHTYR